MKDLKDILRVAGILALGLFVFVVAVPLVLTAAGFVLAGVGAVISLAVLLIKIAVFLAVGYLVLAGVRALLK